MGEGTVYDFDLPGNWECKGLAWRESIRKLNSSFAHTVLPRMACLSNLGASITTKMVLANVTNVPYLQTGAAVLQATFGGLNL